MSSTMPCSSSLNLHSVHQLYSCIGNVTIGASVNLCTLVYIVWNMNLVKEQTYECWNMIISCLFVDVVNLSSAQMASRPSLLYDHRPFQVNNDDYERVCCIPKRKVLFLSAHGLWLIHKCILFFKKNFCLLCVFRVQISGTYQVYWLVQTTRYDGTHQWREWCLNLGNHWY